VGGGLFRPAVVVDGRAEGRHGLFGRLAGGVGPEEERGAAAAQLAIRLRLAGVEPPLGSPRIGGEARDRLGGIGVDARGRPLERRSRLGEPLRRGIGLVERGDRRPQLVPLGLEAAGLFLERLEARGVALDRRGAVVAGQVLGRGAR